MKDLGSKETVLFEPWNLGDVMIAAAALRELPYQAALACNPRWHSLLRSAFSPRTDVRLIPVELAYTTRNRAHPLEFSSHNAATSINGARLVLSIRGDLRDYFAARRIFPAARIRMTGWIRFLARKNSLVDFPFSSGFLPVENRYRSWANLTGVPYDQVASTYVRTQARASGDGPVIIHLGAQWRSKQFPHVIELRDLLQGDGYDVVLVASESDALPARVPTNLVLRAENEELIALLKSAEQVITNDSGPMHLSAFLGCHTTVLVRTSSIEEWIPPATRVIAAEQTPRGYRQKKHYMSDETLPGWPSAMTVAKQIERSR